jgi:hypothetical protein
MDTGHWYIAECRIVLSDGLVHSREATAFASSMSEARRSIREQFARDFARRRIKKVEFLSIARERSGSDSPSG